MLRSWSNRYAMYVQSGPEKIAQNLMHCHFAVESHGFNQNAQKRSLSTNQCKICISWL